MLYQKTTSKRTLMPSRETSSLEVSDSLQSSRLSTETLKPPNLSSSNEKAIAYLIIPKYDELIITYISLTFPNPPTTIIIPL